jgi:hypothetical protein
MKNHIYLLNLFIFNAASAALLIITSSGWTILGYIFYLIPTYIIHIAITSITLFIKFKRGQQTINLSGALKKVHLSLLASLGILVLFNFGDGGDDKQIWGFWIDRVLGYSVDGPFISKIPSEFFFYTIMPIYILLLFSIPVLILRESTQKRSK